MDLASLIRDGEEANKDPDTVEFDHLFRDLRSYGSET